MMKELPLKNSPMSVLVDDEDFLFLQHCSWYCDSMGYVYMGSRTPKLFLHRLLLQAPRGQVVDHINGNPLDNQRENLRLCLQRQNMGNRGANRNNSSGFKGVTFKKSLGRWNARIGHGAARKHLGYFDTAQEAADAYDSAAIALHGIFAATNSSNRGRRPKIVRYPTKRETPRELGQVPLGNDVFAVVSPEDDSRVNSHRWSLKKDNGYVASAFGGNTKWYLHRFVMDCPKGMVVDHINGNKLDNRRENLRICTQTQNHFNRRKLSSSNTTGYTGVRLVRGCGRFQAYYKINGVFVNVGVYATAEEAARARDTAVRSVAGNFLNPTSSDPTPLAPSRIQKASKYRGVTRSSGKWCARIGVGGGKNKHLGRFRDGDIAAIAYDYAALASRGDKARLNFQVVNAFGRTD